MSDHTLTRVLVGSVVIMVAGLIGAALVSWWTS